MNFRETNLTRINYMHNQNIIQSVNVIKQFKDLTTVQEEPGEYHSMPDSEMRLMHQWADSVNKIKILSSDTVTNWAHRIIIYIIVVIAPCITYKKFLHKKIFQEGKAAKQVRNKEEMFIKQLITKYAEDKV